MTPEKQRLILETTLQLVRERGYADVTIEEIAAVCESSKATIYRFWPGKPALVAASLLHNMPAADDFPDTGSLRGDMLLLYRLPESEPEFDPFMIATIVKMGFESPEIFENTNRGIIEALSSIIYAFLERSAARGEYWLSTEDADLWARTCVCYAVGFAPSFGERMSQHAFERLYDRVLVPALEAHNELANPAR